VSLTRRIALIVAGAAVAVPAVVLTRAESAPVASVARSDAHTQVVRLMVAGQVRSYRLFVPSPLPPGPRPLLVALHPLHGTAAKWELATGLDAGAQLRGAYVAYPEGVGRSWDAGTCCGVAAARGIDDVQVIAAVIGDVESRRQVDRARVAVTGFSNGGLMSYRFACARSDLVDVAVVAAGDLLTSQCAPTRPVSMLHVHGLRDRVIPYAGVAHSPIDRFGFPPAPTSIGRLAAADGCAGGHTASLPDGELWTAVGCPAGVHLALRSVASLPHAWPTGGRGLRRYGLDMTELTWSFVSAAWANAT
jgi:poly(3-hydroxybutyrate) depolymerase